MYYFSYVYVGAVCGLHEFKCPQRPEGPIWNWRYSLMRVLGASLMSSRRAIQALYTQVISPALYICDFKCCEQSIRARLVCSVQHNGCHSQRPTGWLIHGLVLLV